MLMMILLFCLAISLDGVFVGLSYGVQKISLPLLSILLVSLISGIVLFISMWTGSLFSEAVPEKLLTFFAATALALAGFWRIMSVRRKHRPRTKENVGEAVIFSFKIPLLHIVIQILRFPEHADLNRDGRVDATDSIMLGVALALDSLTAGFAAAMAGLPPLLTGVVSVICCFACISLAVWLGGCFRPAFARLSHNSLVSKAVDYSSGAVLLLLALWRILS